MIWNFEVVDPDRSSSSGKISDLFRNEASNVPGLLAEGAPPFAASLMVREMIQNSWDAARELQDEDPEAPEFSIDFEFAELQGGAKRLMIENLGLSELAERANAVALSPEVREKLGPAPNDCLTSLESSEPLRVCQVIEHGAVGMHGPWKGKKSRMFLALAMIGINEKREGAGGTFGYGKAGMAVASLTRVVIAYSCFRERDDDPGVTRRLLGMTYWGGHEFGDDSFNGYARFGERRESGGVAPLVNEHADSIAVQLGMTVRSPVNPEALGTTFLIIDPSVDPGDLKEGVERHWWPALVDQNFSVIIRGYGGEEHVCRPKENDKLAAFLEAYSYLSEHQVPDNVRRISLGEYRPQGGKQLPLGTLVLISDPSGWSFPEMGAGTNSAHQSLIALMRETRMVIEYHQPGQRIGQRPPFVRGVFVASSEVNNHLAKTEPKGHDRWEVRGDSEDVPIDATRFAEEILKRIRDEVAKFQNELRPKIDSSRPVRLPWFDRRLKGLRRRDGSTPPNPKGNRIVERETVRIERVADGEADRLEGVIKIRLSENYKGRSPAHLRIRFALAIDEDGTRGENVKMHVENGGQPLVDTKHGAIFDGEFDRSWKEFSFRSEKFRADWTTDLLIELVPEQKPIPQDGAPVASTNGSSE